MLKIRLARWWRKKAAFYRVVLTEHTKPVKSWYKTVLGRHDPVRHDTKLDIEAIKEWIAKWAQPSNRVAKICLKESGDDFFKAYITHSTRVRKKKNAPDEPEEVATPEPKKEEPVKEEVKAEEPTKEEPAKEEVKAEEQAAE